MAAAPVAPEEDEDGEEEDGNADRVEVEGAVVGSPDGAYTCGSSEIRFACGCVKFYFVTGRDVIYMFSVDWKKKRETVTVARFVGTHEFTCVNLLPYRAAW